MHSKIYIDCIDKEKPSECALREMFANIESVYENSIAHSDENSEYKPKWWVGGGIWTPTSVDLLNKDLNG